MGDDTPTALVIGASRAIGLAMAEELVQRGWRVIGTVRGSSPSDLRDLAARSGGRLEVETADLADPESLRALRQRLDGRTLDLLFVNGAITNGQVPPEEVDTDEFVEVMVVNALGPMRAIGALQDLVPPTGTIGVMSSRQGSIAANTNGGYPVYRSSKSALNQFLRSHVAERGDDPRTYLLINPGHVQTELGGPGAPLTIGDSVPKVVDVVLAQQGHGGLQFLSYTGEVVPW